jgi:hypothetical protein
MEQQYYISYKFNQYRGLGGAFWQVIRYYFIGLIGTFMLLAYLKSWGHDSFNYYNVQYVLMEGKPGHTPGQYYAVVESVKQTTRNHEGQDVLDRSIY